MADTRHRNANWMVTDDQGRITTWEQVQVALLMDIRDELQRLNRVLQCPNFIAVPLKLDLIRQELREVRRNTKKRKRVAKPKLRAVA